MAVATTTGEVRRKELASKLMFLCLDMASGKLNQQQAFNRLDQIAPGVIELVKDGTVNAPEGWPAVKAKSAPVVQMGGATKPVVTAPAKPAAKVPSGARAIAAKGPAKPSVTAPAKPAAKAPAKRGKAR